MSVSNIVRSTAAAAALAVAISMAFAAMAYADKPAGKALESEAITGVTSSDIVRGDANASSTEAEDARTILRAPGSGVDYSGYKLTVGLFDDGGNQVGGNYEVAYNGGPTTVEGLAPSKVYTARVLALVDADGNDALSDFDNAVEESEKLVAGAEQGVWTKTLTFNITSTPLAKYTVKWLNDDGTELEVDAGLKRGETPSYDGAEPTKAADAQYTYTFAGWDAPIAPVTGDATYKATFNRTLRTYTVTWVNEDGTVIETDAGVPYGTTPSFDSPEPTKAEDDTYTYAFAGWDTAVAPVMGDVTYKATFKATAKPAKPGKPGDQKDPQNKPSKAKTDKESKKAMDKESKKAMDKESKSSDSKKTGRATMPKTGDATDIALPMGAALAAGAAGYVALRRKNRNDA